MTLKTLKWHLLVNVLKLGAINDTGKPQKAYGSTYTVTVQPGESVVQHHDSGMEGY